MQLFQYEEEDTEYSRLHRSLECIACSAFFATVAIVLWVGSQLVGGSEL